MYWVEERRNGVSTGLSDPVSKDDWPFAIYQSAEPFALGAIVALCHNKHDADELVLCYNLMHDEK